MARRIPSEVVSHWHHLIENYNTSAYDFYALLERALVEREVPDLSTEYITLKEGGFASAEREYLRVRRGSLIFDVCASPFGTGFFFSWWLAKDPRGAFGWLAFLALLLLAYAYGFLLFFNQTLLSLTQAVASGGNYSGGCSLLWFVLLTPVVLYVFGRAVRAGAFGPDERVIETPIIGRLYVFLFGPKTYHQLDSTLMFQESVRRAVLEAIEGIRKEQGLRALLPEEQHPTMKLLTK